jgi:hypothetical protein
MIPITLYTMLKNFRKYNMEFYLPPASCCQIKTIRYAQISFPAVTGLLQRSAGARAATT